MPGPEGSGVSGAAAYIFMTWGEEGVSSEVSYLERSCFDVHPSRCDGEGYSSWRITGKRWRDLSLRIEGARWRGWSREVEIEACNSVLCHKPTRESIR